MTVTPAEALQYEEEALLANIERIDRNIETFEDAIKNESAQKERLQQMVNIIRLHKDD